jgi:hypothetical protein
VVSCWQFAQYVELRVLDSPDKRWPMKDLELAERRHQAAMRTFAEARKLDVQLARLTKQQPEEACMPYSDASIWHSADPHGYQPIIVDEDFLTPEERTQETMDFLASIADQNHARRNRDLKAFMTPAELEVFERPFVRDSPFGIGVVSVEQEEEKNAIAVQAGRRAYARDKYANGQGVWYGDGLPNPQQSG